MQEQGAEEWQALGWDEERVSELKGNLETLRARFPRRSSIFDACISSLNQISTTLSSLRSNFPAPSNPKMLRLVLSKFSSYLQETEKLCADWDPLEHLSMHLAIDLLMLSSKYESLSIMLPLANSVPTSDLFSLESTHSRWRELGEIVKIVAPTDPEELRKGIRKMAEGLIFGNAVVGKGFECAHPRAKEVAIGAGAVLYRFSKKKTRTQALLNYARPSKDSILALWNMLDSVLMSPMVERGLVDIPLVRVIHLPRIGKPVLSSGNSDVFNSFQSPRFSEVAKNDFIPVRVVSPFVLPGLRVKQKSSWWDFCCGGRKPVDYPTKRSERVIIHVHGGGFIAMTSKPHQIYIRRWAIQTNTPILCVDYRLAPEFPFPAALDDVWQTYLWVLRHAEECLGISPKTVVLAGDSAGGNLILGCALRALEQGIHPPDGLLLSYPAISLDPLSFSPSHLLSLDDMVLHHTFLRLCYACYVQDAAYETQFSYYLSPILAPDTLLGRLPRTRIVIGSEDPLHDDCWRLTERLKNAGGDVKMTVFRGLVHGGMNFSMRNGMKDGLRMVDQAASFLSELLS